MKQKMKFVNNANGFHFSFNFLNVEQTNRIVGKFNDVLDLLHIRSMIKNYTSSCKM